MGCTATQQVKTSTVIPDEAESAFKRVLEGPVEEGALGVEALVEETGAPAAKLVEHSMAQTVTLRVRAGACGDPGKDKFYGGDNQVFVSSPTGAEIEVAAPGYKIVAVQAEGFPVRAAAAVLAQGKDALQVKSPGVEGFTAVIVGGGTADVTISGCGRPVLSVAHMG